MHLSKKSLCMSCCHKTPFKWKPLPLSDIFRKVFVGFMTYCMSVLRAQV